VGDCLVGEAVPGLALVDTRTTFTPGGTLSGRIAAVTHGRAADAVVCVADNAAGPVLVLADVRRAVDRQAVTTADLGGPVADLVVADAPAVALTTPGDTEGLARHEATVALVLAAEQVGGATGCLTGIVDYAGVRTQFGQLIGSYQAIQHRCSTLAIAATAARALVAAAAAATDAGQDQQARTLGLLARAEAAEVFNRAADDYIQVSGGIGFTWEHDAHLYFRHARSTAALGGVPVRHRDAAVEAGCLDLLLAPAS
jgi:alkylation response protein AidB-like acyl-CoA dehydrogenase